MSLEADWQTTRPTIRERAKFMLNNDRLSDVKFVVRKIDGETESESKILKPSSRWVDCFIRFFKNDHFEGEIVSHSPKLSGTFGKNGGHLSNLRSGPILAVLIHSL